MTVPKTLKPSAIASGRGDLDTLPDPLRPRENENDRAYAAFLLWCLSEPSERSKRLIGSSLSCGEANVRMWSKKYGWDRRLVQVPDAEWHALRGFRALMDLQNGAGQVAALRLAMDVVLDRAGYASVRHKVAAERQGEDTDTVATSQPAVDADAPKQGKQAPTSAFSTPLSDNELSMVDPSSYMRRLRSGILQDHLKPEDVRRQILLIDATLGYIARKVQSGELRVQVSDIPQLLKARALLTGLPTEQVAVAAHLQVQHQHTHEVAVESARMAEGRKNGGDALLSAMQEEVAELSTILRAVPRGRAQIIDATVKDEA